MSEQGLLAVRNVPVAEAWERLKRNPKTQLVDVRTKAEWNFVGVPDLSKIGRAVILIEWQTYPQGATTEDFTDRCAAAIEAAGATPDDEVFFLCRSGARSLSAARAMAGIGFSKCLNVAEGFEGPLDDHRHRSLAGWKVAGLPWYQA